MAPHHQCRYGNLKQDYLVLSVPEYNNAIGYASLTDYNNQKLSLKHFENGQSVTAIVGEVSSSGSTGRLIFLLYPSTGGSENSNGQKESLATRWGHLLMLRYLMMEIHWSILLPNLELVSCLICHNCGKSWTFKKEFQRK